VSLKRPDIATHLDGLVSRQVTAEELHAAACAPAAARGVEATLALKRWFCRRYTAPLERWNARDVPIDVGRVTGAAPGSAMHRHALLPATLHLAFSLDMTKRLRAPGSRKTGRTIAAASLVQVTASGATEYRRTPRSPA
jgi:hypothetical protein